MKPIFFRCLSIVVNEVLKRGLESPLPSFSEVESYYDHPRSESSSLPPDIDLREEEQFQVLADFYNFYPELPFPEYQNQETRYYYAQDWFCYADAIFLYCFLRKHRPRRIIEIGSGFSSAVMLDTTERFAIEETELIFIDPCCDRLRSILTKNDTNRVKVIEKKLQDVPLEDLKFKKGDFLFIDSSHILKCGSDLHYIFYHLLPILPSGVFVHFHDVFFPFEYPKHWIKSGKFWNEIYLLRAFLSNNNAWAIYFFNSFVGKEYSDFLSKNMPLCLKNTGGSIYLMKN